MGVTTIPKSPSAIEPLSFMPTLSNGHAVIERPRPVSCYDIICSSSDNGVEMSAEVGTSKST